MNLEKQVMLVATVLSLSVPTALHAADGIKLMPEANLDWDITPEGVAFAPLEGKRFEESYMAMVRLPAGLVSPVHVKTATMYGLVVSGQMVHVAEENIGKRETVLEPGDYYQIPAGLPHLSKCVSGVECVTFLYQDGPFDFLPVGEGNQ